LPIIVFADNITDDYIDNLTAILYTKHYIPKEFSIRVLTSLKVDNQTLYKISNPKEAISWDRYKPIFITKDRITMAKEFLNEHYEFLDEVEQTFKVDKYAIIAIIAIESYFGKYKPVHNVGDALYTLARYYPPRSKFFTQELISYVILRYLDKTYDNDSLKGSYAGAIGFPQFMPSSILNYGIDYDNDCRIDLVDNWKDTIASIAYYLKKNGWQYREKVAKQIKIYHNSLSEDNSASDMTDDYIIFDGQTPLSPTLAVKQFAGSKGTELWAVYKNFNVIKRYNNSDNYALTAYNIMKALEKNGMEIEYVKQK
jgi:membrane-bound lytic murein transglycosylase B